MTDAELIAILRLPVEVEKFLEPVAQGFIRLQAALKPVAQGVGRLQAAMKPYEPQIREALKFFADPEGLNRLAAPIMASPSWASPYLEPTPAISNEGSQPTRRPIGFGPWPAEGK